MRKSFGLTVILALSLGAVAVFSAPIYKYVPRTTSGTKFGPIKVQGADPHGMVALKAQNKLSSTVNQLLLKQRTGLGGSFNAPGIKNGTVDTIPYFNSWFVTGSRNSVYTYSMVGQNPAAGGTTGINNQLIPLITILLFNGAPIATFDPTAANDPAGTDMQLVAQSPLYDATTTYPGNGGTLPPDTGQFVDTAQRASFNGIRAANWHTLLNPPSSSGIVWIQFLEYLNGDWALTTAGFPVFNISVISNNFAFILAVENPPNNEVPIIVTDWLTAFDPNTGGCCVLGYHNASPGIQDPSGILVWTWATFIPQAPDNGLSNPFGPFGSDVMVFSHEIDELFNDPFINNTVAPWVDGSVSFAQANLETGDAIEAMNASDVIYTVPLNPNGTPYVYTTQNEALLPWFTRNPLGPVTGPGPGIYSWPNTNTLNNGHNPAACFPPPGGGCYVYGEGSAGFFFGPPY